MGSLSNDVGKQLVCSIHADEDVSQQVLELTAVVAVQTQEPMSRMAQSLSAASIDDLARLRGIMLSSALLSQSESGDGIPAAASRPANGHAESPGRWFATWIWKYRV